MWRLRMFVDHDHEDPPGPRRIATRVLGVVIGWVVLVLTLTAVALVVEAVRP